MLPASPAAAGRRRVTPRPCRDGARGGSAARGTAFLPAPAALGPHHRSPGPSPTAAAGSGRSSPSFVPLRGGGQKGHGGRRDPASRAPGVRGGDGTRQSPLRLPCKLSGRRLLRSLGAAIPSARVVAPKFTWISTANWVQGKEINSNYMSVFWLFFLGNWRGKPLQKKIIKNKMQKISKPM